MYNFGRNSIFLLSVLFASTSVQAAELHGDFYNLPMLLPELDRHSLQNIFDVAKSEYELVTLSSLENKENDREVWPGIAQVMANELDLPDFEEFDSQQDSIASYLIPSMFRRRGGVPTRRDRLELFPSYPLSNCSIFGASNAANFPLSQSLVPSLVSRFAEMQMPTGNYENEYRPKKSKQGTLYFYDSNKKLVRVVSHRHPDLNKKVCLIADDAIPIRTVVGFVEGDSFSDKELKSLVADLKKQGKVLDEQYMVKAQAKSSNRILYHQNGASNGNISLVMHANRTTKKYANTKFVVLLDKRYENDPAKNLKSYFRIALVTTKAIKEGQEVLRHETEHLVNIGLEPWTYRDWEFYDDLEGNPSSKEIEGLALETGRERVEVERSITEIDRLARNAEQERPNTKADSTYLGGWQFGTERFFDLPCPGITFEETFKYPKDWRSPLLLEHQCRYCLWVSSSSIGRDEHEDFCEIPCKLCQKRILGKSMAAHLTQCPVKTFAFPTFFNGEIALWLSKVNDLKVAEKLTLSQVLADEDKLWAYFRGTLGFKDIPMVEIFRTQRDKKGAWKLDLSRLKFHLDAKQKEGMDRKTLAAGLGYYNVMLSDAFRPQLPSAEISQEADTQVEEFQEGLWYFSHGNSERSVEVGVQKKRKFDLR